MDQFLVVWNGVIESNTPESAEKALDSVMEHLLDCDEVVDPTLSYDIADRAVTVELILSREDPREAVNAASCILRACLLAAEVATPDWPVASELVEVTLADPSIKRLVDA